MPLSAGEVLTRCEGGKITGTVSVVENLTKCDISTFLTVSNQELEAVPDDNGCLASKRAAHLLAILQGKLQHRTLSHLERHKMISSVGRRAVIKTIKWRRPTSQKSKPG
jgi:hypothetical protein